MLLFCGVGGFAVVLVCFLILGMDFGAVFCVFLVFLIGFVQMLCRIWCFLWILICFFRFWGFWVFSEGFDSVTLGLVGLLMLVVAFLGFVVCGFVIWVFACWWLLLIGFHAVCVFGLPLCLLCFAC